MRPVSWYLLLSVGFIPMASLAQNNELGLMPRFNINKKLKQDWSINLQIESRNALVEEEVAYDYLLTDVSTIVAKKLTINTTVAGGYLMRWEDGEMIHRAIQQVVFVQRLPDLILAHRLSTDQTFEADEVTEMRLRYRLSTQIPLNGQSLDPKEFFIKLSLELLNEWQNQNYDLESRGVAFLGYALAENSKLELGLDYRLDRLIAHEARNRLWIGLNYYISI